MKSILDKDFKYTPSIETNLRATFAKVRRKLAAEQRQREACSPRPSATLGPRPRNVFAHKAVTENLECVPADSQDAKANKVA
jgi:hypothetical protein